MHTSSPLKKEFLKKWMEGLQICCSSKKQMNVLERKKKIKLSADIAMASAKKTPTSWSNALISYARRNEEYMILTDQLLGPESQFNLQKSTDRMIGFHKRVQCKKILKRRNTYSAGKRTKKKTGHPRLISATLIAKRLVKKRTKVLKRLVPGGESMDEFSLIKEALDYILSLKVQVDVMRSVVTATEILSNEKSLKSVE
ncbi:transcription factor IBH1-like 1 [Cynara cardunculus var. scolymus]|uniref:Myc-type, basic helix-loop-helix (BHLH) domain-containing protein n=1 Tax=Cynara cardunculus var. scolymus TaxID=59895 RepID=A0A118K757_CYNCS|nr:transcription factor IBH1-like 1 [Cynara cardunculus var. scolymus]KVI11747.1 Myc-type, basic helix-loop-helix (bHLH) domain-containing protein [Cynara cardunculus var. scolymus]